MAAYARARVLLTHLRRWAVCCPADMLELGAAQYLRDEREDDATEPTHDKSWAQAELSCMRYTWRGQGQHGSGNVNATRTHVEGVAGP